MQEEPASAASRSAALRRLALLSLALGAFGCGPSVKGLRHDPSFDYASMSADQIGVGGVTSLVHETDDVDALRSQLASMLRLQMLDAQGAVEVTPTGVFRSTLGGDAYGALLDEYRLNGQIDRATLAVWDSSFGGACRYVVFARIEDDIVKESSSSGEEHDAGVQYAVTKLSTTRTLTVAFSIYDLHMTKSVWSAHLTDGRANTNKYRGAPVPTSKEASGDKKEKKEEKSTVEEIVVAVVEMLTAEEMVYPEPPTLTEVAERVFRGFAKNLPEAPKK
ncbi:MAG: hypothetical protein JSW67_13350 [Candidatus Latescibacterota bacterium]|nr:MAG: hypothetical protein JSW67_13350 [Candidatus Latescibacterota bacterium]